MTDTTGGASAPTKKRSFFKKALWQTEVKPDGEAGNIFSHANEYTSIVADETRRKNEEKNKLEAEQQRKTEEDRQRRAERERERKAEGGSAAKRRRISNEPEPHSGGSSLSTRADRKMSKGRSRTPLSPVPARPPPDSLSARYDSLTKSASSSDSLPRKPSQVIDLGDSGSDSEDNPYKQAIPLRSLKRALSEDVEEVQDPTLAALAAKARARAAANTPDAASRSNSGPALVQLFIQSEIPDAKPLLIKIKLDYTLEKARKAWCQQQKFTLEQSQAIFLTWKGNKLYDTTTIARLGVQVDRNGNIRVAGDTQIYDNEENLAKIALAAWTDEVFQAYKKRAAEEAAAKTKAAEAEEEPEPPPPEPEPVVKTTKIILKAPGRENFRLIVNPWTTFEYITAAYKKQGAIPDDQPITLTFDGERLKPMDEVRATEIEDMDAIEVLFR
ncbi:ubiquitin-2 like Rad60 SUMO-like-domain-containing protein [Massariosphaeria phaeospora]|uniref:Ubiquitin-2 like Rad60 SUMO-like-domain-containing protein n=1 Tax=Massariosphaeria phaeospora TaxID=100035 RepID=A0A7C8IGY0_9PLEO|nr:ubiquitin-2 like Rad60 SUMO-like-domain-containing protein [Massariosphaeria phaeospora]